MTHEESDRHRERRERGPRDRKRPGAGLSRSTASLIKALAQLAGQGASDAAA